MATNQPVEVLTADELAAMLRVSRKSVYASARRGEIPGTVRIGRLLRFDRRTVVAWIGQVSVASTFGSDEQ